MLAGPSSTLATMAQAISTTIYALDAASELDLDRSDGDRMFFAVRKALLTTYRAQLVAARRALEDHDLDIGARLQIRVEIGDQILDRGISDSNTRTKLALKGKAGLDASHVFGKNVASLTKQKLALEPRKVLQAVERLNDLAEFPERAAIAADLTRRAHQEQSCLDARTEGDVVRARLVSAGIKLVLDAANALAATKGALDEQFPRQREYVAAFFLDVAPARSRSSAEGPPAEESAPRAS